MESRMTGKLAWSIGLALGGVGLVLFLIGFMMRSDEDLKRAKDRIPREVLTQETVDQLRTSRTTAANQIKARQAEAIAATGRTISERLDPMVLRTERNFITQQFAEIYRDLQARVDRVTKRPVQFSTSGVRTEPTRVGSPFRNMEERFESTADYSADNFALARHAVGVAIEFIAAVEAARTSVGPDEEFDLLSFVLEGDGIRFHATAERALYGESDPFVRRNMRVEFAASPVMSQAIIAQLANRPLKAPLIRLVGVQSDPYLVPTGVEEHVSVARTRELLRSFVALPQSIKASLQSSEMGGLSAERVEAWLLSAAEVAENPDDKAVEAFVAVTGNQDRIRRIVDLLPDRFRQATPSRTRLTLQLLVPNLDSPVFGELTAARRGIPDSE
jgi:hypothetical protein